MVEAKREDTIRAMPCGTVHTTICKLRVLLQQPY